MDEGATQAVEWGDWLTLPNPLGLHARPAAILVAQAKKFKSDIRLWRGDKEVNAKSVVSIMGLETQKGDSLRFKAAGLDAAQAIQVLSDLLLQGSGESLQELPQAQHRPLQDAGMPAHQASQLLTYGHSLTGVSASPGLTVGRLFQFRKASNVVLEWADPSALEKSVVHERAHLTKALQVATAQIQTIMASRNQSAEHAILHSHVQLMQDPDLWGLALQQIDLGKTAAFGWQSACTLQAQNFLNASSALLRDRANDVRDVGQRVLDVLLGVSSAAIDLPYPCILVTDELTPSDTVALDRSKLLGFCTVGGGATSHVAILARSYGVPAVCGIDPHALDLLSGSWAVLHGTQGLLFDSPTDLQLSAARSQMDLLQAQNQSDQLAAKTNAVTLDGQRIEVAANVRNAQDTHEALALGADGVGLLRSEFLFEGRMDAPGEDEQAQAYQDVAKALGLTRALVIRTLDIGGDKPLAYLPMAKEDNPFLGLRGVRVSLDQPPLFRSQLRAILSAARYSQLHIMFPMIATLEELQEAKSILAQEQSLLDAPPVAVGIMVEVPSAALLASRLAQEVDFFSIGSNDLTQYTLAMDRGHPKLAHKADSLHPAVLKMVALTCEGAQQHGKWVGVCGAMASDVLAVPVLLGMGVRELSVSVPAIASVKACINRLDLATCQALAKEVVEMGSASEVRKRLLKFMEN